MAKPGPENFVRPVPGFLQDTYEVDATTFSKKQNALHSDLAFRILKVIILSFNIFCLADV